MLQDKLQPVHQGIIMLVLVVIDALQHFTQYVFYPYDMTPPERALTLVYVHNDLSHLQINLIVRTIPFVEYGVIQSCVVVPKFTHFVVNDENVVRIVDYDVVQVQVLVLKANFFKLCQVVNKLDEDLGNHS